MNGRLERTRLVSRVLDGNRLGDPIDREVIVYLPPSYDSGGRYPIVMVLAGFGGTNRTLVNEDLFRPNVVQIFDRLVTSEASSPAILVLPDACTRFGGSQFLDSPATGRYQTYLADEIIAHVDATYRTIPTREARGIVGRSSGGFGALRLGMDRPDVAAVIASHAGDAAFEVSLRPLIPTAARVFDQAGGVAAFLQRVLAKGPSGSDFDALFFAAAAAAYAPEPGAPFPHLALPFDARTAEVDEEVWARFLEHDPIARIPAQADAVRDLDAIYVDAGDSDEYGLQFAARQLVDAFAAAGVTAHYEEFEGGHRGTNHRYELSLPFVVRALARER
jgi:enterochelin esterase family protein